MEHDEGILIIASMARGGEEGYGINGQVLESSNVWQHSEEDDDVTPVMQTGRDKERQQRSSSAARRHRT